MRPKKKKRKVQKRNKKNPKRVYSISDNLSMSSLINSNPITRDSMENKAEYLKLLRKYLKILSRNRRKYERSLIQAYQEILNESEVIESHDFVFYRYYLLLDLFHIMGYELSGISLNKISALKRQYMEDFSSLQDIGSYFDLLIKSVKGSEKKLQQLRNREEFFEESNYINLIEKNISFRKKTPSEIMITATMSAGKSSLVNALSGKPVCLSQNMACTSKEHCVINKAFEDDFFYELDHDLIMNAGKKELFENNESNLSDKITISASFQGELNSHRVILHDSPGVNFSGDEEHKKLSEKLLDAHKYRLLLYVMNATQLATNDEEIHLDFVRRIIGKTPILFVVNKIDTINVEEEDIEKIVQRQISYLEKKGFKNPIVCPTSAKAAYLSKKYAETQLSNLEKLELYNFIDKFKRMNIDKYYAHFYPNIEVHDMETEEAQLLKTSGFFFLEKIIKKIIQGGKVHGSIVCEI